MQLGFCGWLRALATTGSGVLFLSVALLFLGALAVPSVALAAGDPVVALSFNEGQGELARDSANDHDGSVNGAGWTEAGKYGAALQFDGNNDLVTIPDSNELDFTEDFTLEAWVRPDEVQKWGAVITKETTTDFTYLLYGSRSPAETGPFGAVADAESTYSEVRAGGVLPSATWTHLAFTSDGQDLRLYKDGELVEIEPALVMPASNGDLRIGGNEVFDEYFDGRIDEVRLYDEALNAGEIEEDMETAIDLPINTSLPIITAVPYETVDSIGDPGEWSGGTPLSFEYQWKRCDPEGNKCADIEGATNDTYAPVNLDIGHRLRLRVRAINSAGDAEAESNASPKVLPSPPRFVQSVGLEGISKEGGQLEADTDGLRGSPAIDLEYVWKRCDETCSVIKSAETNSYTLTAADVATRISLMVVAENEFGTAQSVSSVSQPIEPAETEGAPRLADRPRLVGLYRVGDQLGSTTGVWRGAEPLTSSLKWQRCTPDLEECVDIAGAAKQLYEPTIEDEGMRLRTIVKEDNGVGQTSSESIASPLILPAVNTVFSADEPVPLSAVAEALDEISAPLLSLTYGGETTGVYSGYATEPMDLISELGSELGINAEELPVSSFALQGDVPAESLGGLEKSLSRSEIPSLHQTLAPTDVESEEEPIEEASFSELLIDHAKINDIVELPPFADRALRSSFGWMLSPTKVLTRIYEVGSPLAVEFDLKLHNESNTNISATIEEVPLQGICLPWESNNFWIDDRDSVLLDTSIPDEAGLYWDTDLSDSCEEKDLTYGIYHPEYLKVEEGYSTYIYFTGDDATGDTEMSEMTWSIQVLGRHCDSSPFCVNIPDVDIEGETLPLIAKDEKFHYHSFWEDRWGPAALPWCYEFDSLVPQEFLSPGAFSTEPCVWEI